MKAFTESKVGKVPWVSSAGSVGKAAGVLGAGCVLMNEPSTGQRVTKMMLRGRKGYFILCLNMISLGYLSQHLYCDLLDTVDYSGLKQKLILLLII